jgi:hypothetical protein
MGVQPHGKPGGRLVEDVNEYGDGVGRDGARRPTGGPPAAAERERDLVAECERRGIPLDDERRAYLRHGVWTPQARRQLMTVVEACEEAGVPFTLAFEHVDDETVVAGGVEIRMRGH